MVESTANRRAALGWIFAAGATIGLCVVADGRGVRASGSPWAYGITICCTNAAVMAWRYRQAGLTKLLQEQAYVAVPTALVACVSYFAILWVYTRAPLAPSAALRDTSALFAVLIAVFWLGERLTATRLLAVAMAALAVPLLRFA